jgi:hypothetical protein
LWCKNDDIHHFLSSHKINLKKQDIEGPLQKQTIDLISFDDLYESYKIYFNTNVTIDKKTHPIVSKNFFEKFMLTQLSEYVKFEKFVSSDWLNS